MANFEDVLRIATQLPETELSRYWGTQSVKARGKMLLRRHEDPDLIVLKVDSDEREVLCSERPDAFMVTPHYENYSYMLVRYELLEPDELSELITDAWVMSVPKGVARVYREQKTPDSKA